MIEARGISKSYGSLQVLKGVDFQAQKAEVVSITGPSGAGKSTLLHVLGTLDMPDSGNIRFDGTEISTFSAKKLALFRNKNIGFVFQFHHLLPEFTAIENVMIPAMIAGTGKRECNRRAMELLELLNVNQRESHKPSELSGGEQQRVAVARALVNSPMVVFADEPSGNLDSGNANDLHKLFFRLRDELKQTFIIVTHNEEFALMADRKLAMRDGRFEGA
ncbi:MAG: ABC transporter ATP-binding protein [Bacteroidetes bacterium]|nr:ABC transporter ATP-binding protein [Bacteroidota bacterium]MBU1718496.1 ABC transporter ATP-binding protein [Bacteroidota bacterium]